MSNEFDPYHVWLGIPPAEQPPNYYRLLGIALFEDNADVISSAADRQMAHLRSFQSGKHSLASQEMLNRVARAKIDLLKPAVKTKYDAGLREASQPRAVVNRPIPVAPAAVPVIQSSGLPVVRKKRPSAGSCGTGTVPATIPLAVCGGGLLLAGLVAWSQFGQSNDVPTPTVALNEAARTKPVEQKPPPVKPRASAAPAEAKPKARAPVANVPAVLPTVTRKVVDPPARQTFADDPAPRFTASSRTTRFPEPATDAAFDGIEMEDTPSGDGGVPDFFTDAAKSSPPEDTFDFESFESADELAVEPAAPVEQAAAAKQGAARQGVPSASEQQAVRKRLNEIYNINRVKTPRDQLRLANQLLEAAAQPSEDLAEHFVLLREAEELACAGGDAALMLQAIDALEQRFEVAAHDSRDRALLRFAETAKSSERVRALMSIARGVISQAVEDQRFDAAMELSAAVKRACQRPGGKEFRKDAVQLRETVQAIVEQQTALAAARAVLRANPKDASANLVVARWHCIWQDDWKQGLPLLAKGDDDELQKLAERELGSTDASTDDQIALADAWWDLGETRQDEECDALLLHAGDWYRRALASQPTGLIKFKLEKRLDDLTSVRNRHEIARNSRTLTPTKAGGSLWSDSGP